MSVRWEWLLLSLALILSATMFLAMSIWFTVSKGIDVWKCSSLPKLFHGLGGQCSERTSMKSSSEMDKIAGSTQARFVEYENGNIKLVRI